MPVGNVCFEPYPQGPVKLSLMEPYHIFFFIFSELHMPALWSYANNNNNIDNGVASLLHYFHAASLPTSNHQSFNYNVFFDFFFKYVYIYIYVQLYIRVYLSILGMYVSK